MKKIMQDSNNMDLGDRFASFTRLKSEGDLIRFLDSFIWSNLHKRNACKDKLSNIKRLCDLLGNPQDKLSIIHIAGSKGKGSVAYILNELLVNGGYNIGLFTSPHIESYMERIQYNSRLECDDILLQVANKILSFIKDGIIIGNDYSCFEILTALAFEYFNLKKVDYAIFEVGLGGRLDSTNIVTESLCSVITQLELEHVDILGDTIEKIAREKGGIIKKSCPVFVGNKNKEANTILSQIAKQNDSDIFFSDDIANIGDFYVSDNKLHFSLKHADNDYVLGCAINSLSYSQAYNVSLAYVVVKKLFADIGDKIFLDSIDSLILKGRFEICHYNNKTVILDVAHTKLSISSFVNTVDRLYGYEKKTLLFSCSQDKNIIEMARVLANSFDEIVICSMASIKPVNLQLILDSFIKYNKNVILIEDWQEAFNKVIRGDNQILSVCGSFFLVSDIRKLIYKGK